MALEKNLLKLGGLEGLVHSSRMASSKVVTLAPQILLEKKFAGVKVELIVINRKSRKSW